VTENNTYIYANFHDENPHEELVEINVRDSCFYPDNPARLHHGPRFSHVPRRNPVGRSTAEQIGLIRTHWSKGWIIENNVIRRLEMLRHNPRQGPRDGPQRLDQGPEQERRDALQRSDRAGARSGLVAREDRLARRPEQRHLQLRANGICGSMAGFQRDHGHHIYNIWAKRQFNGAEMAGIKTPRAH